MFFRVMSYRPDNCCVISVRETILGLVNENIYELYRIAQFILDNGRALHQYKIILQCKRTRTRATKKQSVFNIYYINIIVVAKMQVVQGLLGHLWPLFAIPSTFVRYNAYYVSLFNYLCKSSKKKDDDD